MKKVLFHHVWSSPIAWHSSKDCEKVRGYITYTVYFDFKKGLRFACTVPDITACSRGPFKCIWQILENQSVGMGKYQRLKERVRKLDLWKHL